MNDLQGKSYDELTRIRRAQASSTRHAYHVWRGHKTRLDFIDKHLKQEAEALKNGRQQSRN